MEPIAAVVLGAVLLAVVGVVLLYLSRQRTLARRVGSFSCAMRPEGDPATDRGHARPWRPGIAQYATGRLLWWRAVSLAPRPACTWSRSELTLVERIPVDAVDEHGQPLLLVRCRHGDDEFQLTMSAPACAGLVSWLEAGPRPVGRVI